MTDNPTPGRYHLTLTISGRTVLHGWWDSADTADRKFDGLQALHEEDDRARLHLTEWDAGREWPIRACPADPGVPNRDG